MNEPKLRHKRQTKAEQKIAAHSRRVNTIGHGMALPGLIEEQRRMLAARISEPIVTDRRITNASTRETYRGEIDASSMRPGANDFLEIPSRFCDELRYRDGRKVSV